MRPPHASVAFFGHPVIAGPLVLGGLGLLVLFLTQGEGGFLLAVPVAVGLAWLGKAMEKVSAYRAWKREWDAMGEPPARRAVKWKPVVAVLLVLAAFAYAVANPDRPDAQIGIAFIAVGLLLGLVAAIVRRLRGLRKPSRAKPVRDAGVVAICARSTFPVPALRDAYIALPEHCWQVLGRK